MRVQQTEAAAVLEVLAQERGDECCLARAGLADGKQMKEPVRLADTEEVAIPAAERGTDMRHMVP